MAVINQMLADGVIENYALGGAVAAIFYTEPFATQDVDIFVQIRDTESGLAALSPIYDYLLRRGYEARAEHVYIEGFPVRFLPTFNRLTAEAVEQAQEVKLESVTMRVMEPEHLVAVMLDTGRTKDYLRISMFLQSGTVDRPRLQEILQRHGLSQKWEENARRFEP